MDREEAKHILSLCRPDSDEDWHDPVIAGALAQLESDSELRNWFEAEQAEDARITAQLERIEPPADLKASILAGIRAHARLAETEEVQQPVKPQEPEKLIDFEEIANRGIPTATKKRPRRLPVWAGIAALFAVLFVVVVVLRQNQSGSEQVAQTVQDAQNDDHTTVATITPDVINFLADKIEGLMAGRTQLEQLSDQIAPLTTYLASSGAPVPNKVPVDLDQLPTLGCIALDYNDSKLSIICFKNNEVIYHLVTVRKAAVHSPLSTEPQYFETKGQAFKLWSEGEQAFILTTQGTKDQLPDLI